MKIRASTHATPDLPPKVACHYPIPNIVHQLMTIFLNSLNSKEFNPCVIKIFNVVFGVTQISPINVTLPYEVRQSFKMSSFGVQAKVFVKFMYKTFITFAKQKTSVAGQESTFDASITQKLLLKPLLKSLTISFHVKPMLLRSISRFHYILEHRETREFRYQYANNNNQLINSHH